MNMEGKMIVKGELFRRHIDKNGASGPKERVSEKCITNAFAEMIIDALQGTSVNLGTFKYHDTGTGTNPEAVTDTGLQIPSGLARVVGTQTEYASNVYESVATITYTSSCTITEHGLFNAATGGTLMDRSVVNEAASAGNSIEWTYRFTMVAGG